jgi:hypothetical protein
MSEQRDEETVEEQEPGVDAEDADEDGWTEVGSYEVRPISGGDVKLED